MIAGCFGDQDTQQAVTFEEPACNQYLELTKCISLKNAQLDTSIVDPLVEQVVKAIQQMAPSEQANYCKSRMTQAGTEQLQQYQAVGCDVPAEYQTRLPEEAPVAPAQSVDLSVVETISGQVESSNTDDALLPMNEEDRQKVEAILNEIGATTGA